MGKYIIDGKSYNTETSTEIGHFWNGLGRNDFRNLDEKLYITPKGRFWLEGEGGAMTKYASSAGDMQSEGSGAIVLTDEEALNWCENHDVSTDLIEKYFKIEEG
jgi:hypothetical protein